MKSSIKHKKPILRNLIQIKKNKTSTFLHCFQICRRERVEQKHREKVVARVQEVRSRTPTNMIHVQSRNSDDTEFDDLQRSETLNSIQLLNENYGQKSPRATTPIYTIEDTSEQLANIHI